MFFKPLLAIILSVSVVYGKGGVKCSSCPPCMICDQFIGCTYDNFSPCLNNNLKGFCVNGACNTTIGSLVLSKPPMCKTYTFSRVIVNNVSKITTTLVNDINGLSCTKPGALFESACIKGVCTPYTIGVDRLGNPSGCVGLPNGFLCDTNGVLTDGEKCINQKCVMPGNANTLCLL